MAMSRDRHRALRLLAGSPLGVTEAIMLAHGFTIEMLTILVRDGLATATPETVHAGKRPIEVDRTSCSGCNGTIGGSSISSPSRPTLRTTPSTIANLRTGI